MRKDGIKILFVCTEDWFFRSHFLPLSDAVNSIDNCRLSIICGTQGNKPGLDKYKFKTLPVDFSRSSLRLVPALKLLGQLIVHLRREKPDLIHFIASKPIILGGLASLVVPGAACVYHLTGLGYLGIDDSAKFRRIRNFFIRAITVYLKRKRSWLILENSDDLEYLNRHGKIPSERMSIFGGAGIDPDKYPHLPPPQNQITTAAYVGRMVWSKGVDVLVSAMDQLSHDKKETKLNLFGAPDKGHPNAVTVDQLKRWNKRKNIDWFGHINDTRKVWTNSDIAIIPSRGGEGLPRTLLEAASCGRPLIVSDVAGCRQFVRDGVEGLVVPKENPHALAKAIRKLANNPQLRNQLGTAARARILEQYTESHIRNKALAIYQNLLS